ncbi:daunorubicin resistance protein DrrA family ABC transporter ATP-binding protein [Paenibacillus sp. J31TS4]|uniref:ATP-binding cassette domain-containing protein n=1 Tax=Paenibacillus sp. J31TS4 TaxID=2807195 RepID=UPI001B0ADE3C|nr:ATP-binding cassette domain-containing protein [Paenibacillus sp. J31TS4]GIP38163.1 daunorubicin resistance protein DrrA family ABC transporter ATP-binding protein [Paenibacillus sp. J31TS4]
MSNLAIEAKNVRKRFGAHDVLQGVDLAVPEGSIYALLGPNGAGKTTLIHILSTLVEPDEGMVRICGHELAAASMVKRSISLTGQFAAVDEVLTARENLTMAGRLCGLTRAEARARAEELLARFDLESAADKRVRTYSGGMRRRLDLAISLVTPRPVLFLDEPTTGLDTMSRRTLWDLIRSLKRQGVTVFLTTQYLEEADQLADTIAVLDGGRIVATGTASELKTRLGDEVLELRDGRGSLIRTLSTDGSLQDIRQQLNELAASVPPDTRIAIRKPSLDDVFVALTAQEKERRSS